MRISSNQRGAMDPLMVPLIISVVVVLSLTGFSFWAYTSYVDHRDNVDEKVAEAVTDANEVLTAELEADFAEREKEPNKTYNGPAAFGSLIVSYPKTWSAYIEEDETGSTAIDGYFHPNFVPALSADAVYALRVTMTDNLYSAEVNAFDKAVNKGEVKAKAVNVNGVVGTRIEGTISRNTEGVMVIFPLRDKTLKIWTESTNFIDDYETIVKNLQFTP